MMFRRLRRAHRNHFKTVHCLDDPLPGDALKPRISNMVSTTVLLPPGPYTLPIEAISLAFKGCSQYCPRQFTANIASLTCSDTDTTMLIFRHGMVVVVHTISEMHTIYITQLLRLIIERVQCMVRCPESGQLKRTTLSGRTIFSQCRINNIVGHCSLERRIDLAYVAAEANDCCTYRPSMFPGLKYRIWLTRSQRCECGKTEKRCLCKIRCILFETGSVVLTGGKNLPMVYSAFTLLRDVVAEYPEGAEVPQHERFARRLRDLMVRMQERQQKRNTRLLVPEDDDGLNVVEPPSKKSKLVSINDVLSSALGAEEQEEEEGEEEDGLTPLMRMCEAGHLDNVRLQLMLDPDAIDACDFEGHTALERLQRLKEGERPTHYEEILELLASHMASSSSSVE